MGKKLRTVKDVTDDITRTVDKDHLLPGRAEQFGFRKGMELVNKTIGHVAVESPGEDDVPVCPDCGETMTKIRAESKSGVPVTVWACGCESEEPDL